MGCLCTCRYRLYLDDGRHFLLAARKRKTSTSSQYILTMDSEDLGRSSKGYVGKLRSNFVGTEFVVFDNGTKQAKGNGECSDLGCWCSNLCAFVDSTYCRRAHGACQDSSLQQISVVDLHDGT